MERPNRTENRKSGTQLDGVDLLEAEEAGAEPFWKTSTIRP